MNPLPFPDPQKKLQKHVVEHGLIIKCLRHTQNKKCIFIKKKFAECLAVIIKGATFASAFLKKAVLKKRSLKDLQ